MCSANECESTNQNIENVVLTVVPKLMVDASELVLTLI